MTRSRKPRTQAPPLADTLRDALAQGWHSLAALDALAGGTVSTRRARVHAALTELAAAGVAREERMGSTGAEVRLAPVTLPAPMPDDGLGDADDGGDVRIATPEDIAAADARYDGLPSRLLAGESIAPRHALADYEIVVRVDGDEAAITWSPRDARASTSEPDDYTRFHDALAAGPVEAEPVDAASFYAARTRDTEDAAFKTWAAKKIAEAGILDALEGAHLVEESEEALTREAEGLILIDRTPDANGDDAHYFEHGKAALAATKGPGPSSRCAVCSAPHARHAPDDGHAFTPKPRGRPRVPAAPIHDAAPAVLPRARQRAKRGPVVDVDGGRVERAPCPPCIDCGEEPGSCPEGRCRDCDMDHVCASGSCRECFVWIVREEVAGPLAAQHRSGCSLATAEDWHPRDAADVARVRARREEPEALSTDARAVYDAIKAACPTRAVLADGGTPNASAEPVHMAEPDAAEELRRLLPRPRRAPVVAAPPCRPPICHRDDIHEPSRVRGFARPLCEAHRRWVEAAGGTVEPCPVCAGVEPVPLQQRCVGITHCAACMRALETLPMGAPGAAQ